MRDLMFLFGSRSSGGVSELGHVANLFATRPRVLRDGRIGLRERKSHRSRQDDPICDASVLEFVKLVTSFRATWLRSSKSRGVSMCQTSLSVTSRRYERTKINSRKTIFENLFLLPSTSSVFSAPSFSVDFTVPTSMHIC